jgi:hypothetical protein
MHTHHQAAGLTTFTDDSDTLTSGKLATHRAAAAEPPTPHRPKQTPPPVDRADVVLAVAVPAEIADRLAADAAAQHLDVDEWARLLLRAFTTLAGDGRTKRAA